MPTEEQIPSTVTVLVVDDNRQQLRLLAQIVKEQGYAVRLAPDGQLALTSARAEPPDVLLLDIAMPDMDGYEVCRQLKHDPRTCAIPVIFISAHDETLDKVRAFAVGGVDYITKPFQAEEVVARIKTQYTIHQTQAALRQSEMALQQANAELEQRVAERTAALEQQALELQRRAEENRQFTYVVSHDLRAPLVNLKGFTFELQAALDVAQPLLLTVMDHLAEEQQEVVRAALDIDVPEALTFINAAVTQMDRLINALLKLSRLERYELQLELVDTQALVTSILHTLAHQITERQVQVTIDVLPAIVADRMALEQMLTNVILNALLYLDSDRSGQIRISAERDQAQTTFRIQDNGQGIAPEDLDKVFAPFRRIGRPSVSGEGMGMTYVQALVQRHGGQVRCDSQPGMGTIVSITLPHNSLSAPQPGLPSVM